MGGAGEKRFGAGERSEEGLWIIPIMEGPGRREAPRPPNGPEKAGEGPQDRSQAPMAWRKAGEGWKRL